MSACRISPGSDGAKGLVPRAVGSGVSLGRYELVVLLGVG